MNGDNGYADLVAAAKQIRVDDELPRSEEFDVEVVTRYIAEHAPELTAAREALRRPCRVDVRMVKEFYEEHWPETRSLRDLARLFCCEARLAAAQQNYPRLIRCGMDLLELGNAMRGGGKILDFLIALGATGIGIDVLRMHRSKLNDEQRKFLIGELLRYEAIAEPVDSIIARDHEWEIATRYAETESSEFKPSDPEEIGISLEAQQELHEFLQASIARERALPPEQRHQSERQLARFEQAMLRLFATDLALHRFHTTQHVFPNWLHLLVPKFLPSVPIDPYTSAPLIYRRHGDNFELYSTGPKAVDGGGSFGNKSLVNMCRADLCLDMNDFPEPEDLLPILEELAGGD